MNERGFEPYYISELRTPELRTTDFSPFSNISGMWWNRDLNKNYFFMILNLCSKHFEVQSRLRFLYIGFSYFRSSKQIRKLSQFTIKTIVTVKYFQHHASPHES